MKSKLPAIAGRKLGKFKWSLVGIPDHLGVQNVGGRVGASSGPREFRKIFFKMKSRHDVLDRMQDFGDSEVVGDIKANHRRASELIQKAHSATNLSVVVGGGHDHAYSHLVGLTKGRPYLFSLGCVNIDAHLDLRKPAPEITSGSPFYLAIEAKIIKPANLTEFGIQSHCNAKALWEYADVKKIRVTPFDRLRGGRAPKAFAAELARLSKTCDLIMVSLDLDAASMAYAPGVSAPQAEGFSGSEIIEMMEISGGSKKVCSLGIFELNPAHDQDDKTARLAATAAFHFIQASENRLCR